MREPARSGERIFRGIPVSPGVCRGRVLVFGKPPDDLVPERHVAESELPEQVQRLEQALVETRRKILEVQRQVNQGVGAKDASIFDAHLLVLEDPTLIDAVNRARPAGIKGTYIRAAHLTSTQGPSVKLDLSTVSELAGSAGS